ncbi:hypothetical protein UP09_32680 [Bradyrhizobium sp. LTSP885]|nr:hypothetical protein UP09_32680 [Bradyrhizobium sp. LTSP885]
MGLPRFVQATRCEQKTAPRLMAQPASAAAVPEVGPEGLVALASMEDAAARVELEVQATKE